jgi:hypothetical protein
MQPLGQFAAEVARSNVPNRCLSGCYTKGDISRARCQDHSSILRAALPLQPSPAVSRGRRRSDGAPPVLGVSAGHSSRGCSRRHSRTKPPMTSSPASVPKSGLAKYFQALCESVASCPYYDSETSICAASLPGSLHCTRFEAPSPRSQSQTRPLTTLRRPSAARTLLRRLRGS